MLVLERLVHDVALVVMLVGRLNFNIRALDTMYRE